jgi:hypothetical protein
MVPLNLEISNRHTKPAFIHIHWKFQTLYLQDFTHLSRLTIPVLFTFNTSTCSPQMKSIRKFKD